MSSGARDFFRVRSDLEGSICKAESDSGVILKVFCRRRCCSGLDACALSGCAVRGGITQQYTSQQCSECGHIDVDNRPSRAVFHYQSCGYTEDADTNAAKNILGEGLSLLACPEKGAALIGHREPVQSDRSLKQEIRFRLVA
ncbi:MAG: zinc ribbon domain-containing protein [Dissulfurispiraceae bacterium]